MADLYTQIKTALDKQVDKSPRIRALVYDKARAALDKKLEAFSPPLNTAQMQNQRDKLENILADIEGEYLEELVPPPAGLEVTETIRLSEDPVPTPIEPNIPEPSNVEEEFSEPNQASAFPNPASFVAPEPEATNGSTFANELEQFGNDQIAEEEFPQFETATSSSEFDNGDNGRFDLPSDDNDFGQFNDFEARDPLANLDNEPAVPFRVDESQQNDPFDDPFGFPQSTEYDDQDQFSNDTAQFDDEFSDAGVAVPAKKSRNIGLIIILIILFAALGGLGFAMKDDIASMLGFGGDTMSEPASMEQTIPDEQDKQTPLRPSTSETGTPEETGEGALDDKIREILLPNDDQDQSSTLPQGTDTPTTEVAEAPAEETPVQEPVVAPPLDAVQVKTSLFEQDTQTGDVKSFIGDAKWKLETSVPTGDGSSNTAIRAELNLLEKRDMLVLMKIEKNLDPNLPASHTIEVVFDVPPDFPGGQVSKMGLITARSDQNRPPTPIQGLVQSVTDGYFLVALPNTPLEKQTNLKLLRDAPLLEIRIEYKTGQPGVLRIEKNEQVKRLFDQAFRNWGDI